MKWGTFLTSLRCRSYLAAKSGAYKRPVVNYIALLLFFSPHKQQRVSSSDVNHSFLTMTTFETALGPKYLQSCYFKRLTSARKLFSLVLYGPAGKWKQMSSTREQLIHCYEPPPRLFTCSGEKCVTRQWFCVYMSLASLACCCSVVALLHPHSVIRSSASFCCDLMPPCSGSQNGPF